MKTPGAVTFWTCKLRKALRNQRDQLLAFAGILDQKLAAIALRFELPLLAVREVCLLHRKHPTSNIPTGKGGISYMPSFQASFMG
jgi:hypothetical protein